MKKSPPTVVTQEPDFAWKALTFWTECIVKSWTYMNEIFSKFAHNPLLIIIIKKRALPYNSSKEG